MMIEGLNSGFIHANIHFMSFSLKATHPEVYSGIFGRIIENNKQLTYTIQN
ncbi:MAG: hypothetical protein Q8N05_05370 [Bacteroidota bacterium]|nr:hypothetical protein [Bacteroidota bacterium]